MNDWMNESHPYFWFEFLTHLHHVLEHINKPLFSYYLNISNKTTFLGANIISYMWIPWNISETMHRLCFPMTKTLTAHIEMYDSATYIHCDFNKTQYIYILPGRCCLWAKMLSPSCSCRPLWLQVGHLDNPRVPTSQGVNPELHARWCQHRNIQTATKYRLLHQTFAHRTLREYYFE
jgi:hypothetical protein